MPKALNRMAELELSHKDHVFSLLYASLSYCTPEKNQYAYKLEGFDKDWNYVGSQNKATYTNLPAGTYAFKVKATNNDGIWSNREASLRITIHPPFYWSTASKVLYFILACIVLAFFIRFLLRLTEKKHTAEMSAFISLWMHSSFAIAVRIRGNRMSTNSAAPITSHRRKYLRFSPRRRTNSSSTVKYTAMARIKTRRKVGDMDVHPLIFEN